MEILWTAAQAALLRGVNAVMTTVDGVVAFMQNTFTFMSASVVNIWDSMVSGISQILTLDAAVIMGVVDNIVNGTVAAFDAMVAAVKKSWNWVQSFIVKGYDLAEENRKVDSEMAARAQQRSASRPGVSGRLAQAAETNRQTADITQSRIEARNANAEQTAQARLAENQRLSGERDADANALERKLDELRGTAAERRAAAEQAKELEGQAGEAVRPDMVQQAAAAGAAAAQSQAGTSAAEIVGTFSGAALGQMGFGQSLAQKQLDKLTQIEQNTSNMSGGAVAD